jgi:hypothetical protein
MIAKRLLRHILDDDGLTRGLADPEARMLVEWLVDQADLFAAETGDETADQQVGLLCRRGRAISRFVRLWCYDTAPGAALQLAGTERFHWPLPSAAVSPCELMQTILDWEGRQTRAV